MSGSYSTASSNKLLRAFGADLPIVEATRALHFEVHPRNMKGSKTENALCCGIAKALGGIDVAVFRTFTYLRQEVRRKDTVVKYQNGAEAEAFIAMFDQGMVPTRPIKVVLLPVPITHTKKHLAKRHARAKRIGGTIVRAYRKPSVKLAKVTVVRGRKRFTIVDKSQRCATRYKALAA